MGHVMVENKHRNRLVRVAIAPSRVSSVPSTESSSSACSPCPDVGGSFSVGSASVVDVDVDVDVLLLSLL
jgi:hypothetical protein